MKRLSGVRGGVVLLLFLVALAGPAPAAAQTTASAAFPHGVASGYATSDSAVLWTRTAAPLSLVPELSEAASFASFRALPAARTSADSDNTGKTLASGLKPATTYYYRFRAPDGTLSAVGRFRTAPLAGQAAPVRFAFSGDADWKWAPYPLLDSVNRQDLDFFIFLGDTIYETTSPDGKTVAETLDEYRAKYRENREPRPNGPADRVALRDTYERFGHYMTFDNHETGVSLKDPKAPRYTEGGAPANDGAHTYVNQTAGYEDRVRALAEYQPVPDLKVTGMGDPRLDGTRRFFSSQRWGSDATLIVTDDRSYRDVRLADSDAPEADSPNRTMLGQPQLRWLQDQLLTAQRQGVTWKFVVVSSPIQQIGRSSQVGGDLDGSKSWAGGYRYERNRLLKYIDDNAIDNVVFLTTDNHYTLVNNLRYNQVPSDPNSPLVPARNAFEIITGPIGAGTGNPPVKANTLGLSGRALDRRLVDVLNGDAPNSDGATKGLKQAGLDPVGLEANFPGLVADSIRAADVAPGTVDPLAFASFNTYSYALVSVDGDRLIVRVDGFPAVPDFSTLNDAVGLRAYLGARPDLLLSFQLRAQGVRPRGSPHGGGVEPPALGLSLGGLLALGLGLALRLAGPSATRQSA